MTRRKAEFFDGLAGRWDETSRHDPAKLERILTLLGVKPGYIVLNVGCGTGVMTGRLAERVGDNGKIIGVDFSAGMVAEAKKRFQRDK